MNRIVLEQDVKNGKMTREIREGLCGGYGKVYIYKDTAPNSDPTVFESGKILLEKGSTIGYHRHTEESEVYTVLSGKIEVNAITYKEGEFSVCLKGETHSCRNLAEGESIIGFSKRK